jgi:hypothetical protein
MNASLKGARHFASSYRETYFPKNESTKFLDATEPESLLQDSNV